MGDDAHEHLLPRRIVCEQHAPIANAQAVARPIRERADIALSRQCVTRKRSQQAFGLARVGGVERIESERGGRRPNDSAGGPSGEGWSLRAARRASTSSWVITSPR